MKFKRLFEVFLCLILMTGAARAAITAYRSIGMSERESAAMEALAGVLGQSCRARRWKPSSRKSAPPDPRPIRD